MKHQVKGRKFGRIKGRRNSFMKNLAVNLIEKNSITTTDARAKELRPFIEKLITIAKNENLQALRRLVSKIGKRPALKLFYDIAPKYKERKGGYTRIIKISKYRIGDGSRVSRIEFV